MSAIRRIDPGHPAYRAALHRTTRYPAEHVTLTASSRKEAAPCVPASQGRARQGRHRRQAQRHVGREALITTTRQRAVVLSRPQQTRRPTVPMPVCRLTAPLCFDRAAR